VLGNWLSFQIYLDIEAKLFEHEFPIISKFCLTYLRLEAFITFKEPTIVFS
jgi:hypothetical protein